MLFIFISVSDRDTFHWIEQSSNQTLKINHYMWQHACIWYHTEFSMYKCNFSHSVMVYVYTWFLKSMRFRQFYEIDHHRIFIINSDFSFLFDRNEIRSQPSKWSTQSRNALNLIHGHRIFLRHKNEPKTEVDQPIFIPCFYVEFFHLNLC